MATNSRLNTEQSVEFEPGLVSIMMPAYQAEAYIRQAIESVLSQTHSHWELVIINDGSQDQTGEIARSYRDSRIRVFDQPNAGEAAARNRALAEMRGEFIAFLDADDYFLPHHLETILNKFQQSAGLEGVYSDGYHCDADGVRMQLLSARRRGPFEGRIFEQFVRASDVLGPPLCAILRRQIVLEQGLSFDPRIVIGPDWDFFTRFSQFARFGYVANPTCCYRIHSTNITFSTTNDTRRASLVICREKAIQLPGFSALSLPTRNYVFYDLLNNLLTGYPEQQEEVTRSVQFQGLPRNEQAHLYRRMASLAIARGVPNSYPNKWLGEALRLNPRDWRSFMLATCHRLTPKLCKKILNQRTQTISQDVVPIGDNFST